MPAPVEVDAEFSQQRSASLVTSWQLGVSDLLSLDLDTGRNESSVSAVSSMHTSRETFKQQLSAVSSLPREVV